LKEFNCLWAGVDVGAATTKTVLIDPNGEIIAHSAVRSGVDYMEAARETFEGALYRAKASPSDVERIVATGYGRHNVPFAHGTKTEISCHLKGCHHHFPISAIIVDIGGQDCKVIHMDSSGARKRFKMNRKCAAGTGAFLEEMAMRLGLELSQLDPLARGGSKRIKLGAYCTVFTATEVLALIRRGEKAQDIARGIFEAVAERIMEMDPLDGQVILSGGVVHHHPIIAEVLSERLGREVLVPPQPQFMGALGAALYAMEEEQTREGEDP
jgi:predicted CoA-substrate-specific enzyme activase